MKKYNKEELTIAVSQSKTIAEVLNKLGLIPNGGNYKVIQSKIKEYDIDISHFCRTFLGRPRILERNIDDYLKNKFPISSFRLKNKLFQSRIFEKKCMKCGIISWNNKEAPLELDHIDGNSNNNQLSNLRILCPNCHAQTKTYRGKNQSHKKSPKKYPKKKTNTCCDCNVLIFSHAERCRSCSKKLQPKKFNVSYEELFDLICVQKLALTKVGKIFDVSDNAIRKRCKSLGIDFKNR